MSAKKKILLLATGGTIASKKSENGLKPQITPEELLEYIPQVKEFCEVSAIQLLNLDSSNMEPEHWKKIVHAIREYYDAYDGFVIAHGTDTMAYTAAALSYMIQNYMRQMQNHRACRLFSMAKSLRERVQKK